MSITLDDYFSENQVAEGLDVTVTTLRCWAARRKGPPRTVVGRQVLYRKQALRQWLLTRERDPEAARQARRTRALTPAAA